MGTGRHQSESCDVRPGGRPGIAFRHHPACVPFSGRRESAVRRRRGYMLPRGHEKTRTSSALRAPSPCVGKALPPGRKAIFSSCRQHGRKAISLRAVGPISWPFAKANGKSVRPRRGKERCLSEAIGREPQLQLCANRLCRRRLAISPGVTRFHHLAPTIFQSDATASVGSHSPAAT